MVSSTSRRCASLHPLASIAGGFRVHAGVGSQNDGGGVLGHGDGPVVHVRQRAGPDQRPRVLHVTVLVLALLLVFQVGVPRRALRGRPHEADGAQQREGDELPHRRDHPRRAPPLVVLVRRLEVDLQAKRIAICRWSGRMFGDRKFCHCLGKTECRVMQKCSFFQLDIIQWAFCTV